MLTAHLPRVSLAHLPTPLEEMKRLRATQGDDCPRLLIKRDDETGLATGGNKTRKLEFLVADALAQGADILVTEGGAQSNHCRQTAAAAVKAGLGCVLVLGGEPLPKSDWRGNLLLDNLLGADIRFAGNRPRADVVAETMQSLREAGKKSYAIATGGSIPMGAAGYVAAVEELSAQLRQRHERITRIVLTAGSGGTHAGVLVGVKALMKDVIIEGMNNFAVPNVRGTVLQLAQQTADMLGLNLTITDSDVVIHDALGDHAYGIITDDEREALHLLARTEAILADPVYTGRAFGEMIRRIQNGHYRPDETILFWHTGGVAGLFPRASELVI